MSHKPPSQSPFSLHPKEKSSPEDTGNTKNAAQKQRENQHLEDTRPLQNKPPAIEFAATIADQKNTGKPTYPSAELSTNPLERWEAEGLGMIDQSRYQIMGEFDRGGLGRILKAEDKRLRRTVALKELLRNRGKASERFLREALITAKLQHPSIVPVYEAGCWPTGEPFYSMKLVEGRSLSVVIREKNRLSDRLGLLPHIIDVCEAVAYAHEEKIIHRDLKPANVLIGSFGETVVIDWGLAKDLSLPKDTDSPASRERPNLFANEKANHTKDPNLTVEGSVVGTLAYMPPEQAYGKPVDERADVYALGAILYHTLSGNPPYTGKSSAEVLNKMIEGPPPPLKNFHPELSQELLTIVTKAMAPEPKKRYPSAKELAKDLKRFQTGQLVGAHSYTPWELFTRWVKRHRRVLLVLAGALLTLLIAGIFSLQSIIKERDRANQAHQIAEQKQKEAEKAQKRAELSELYEAARADDLILVQAKNSLDKDPSKALQWLRSLSSSSGRLYAARIIAADALSRGAAEVFSGHNDWVTEVAFSPDGTWFASAGLDTSIQLWNIVDGRSYQLNDHLGPITSLLFSPDGTLLASASSDKTIKLWNVSTGEHQSTLKGHTDSIESITFSKDGSLLASASLDRSVRLWNLSTKENQVLGEHKDAVWQVLFSPDDTLLASASADQTIKLWDPTEGKLKKNLKGHRRSVESIAFSKNGSLLASGSLDKTVKLWNVPTGKLKKNLKGHEDAVWQVLFSPDDTLLASASLDQTIQLWNILTEESATLAGHQKNITAIQFAPESNMLASASYDHTIKLWDTKNKQEINTLQGHQDTVSSLAFSSKGDLISASFDKTVKLWNVSLIKHSILPGHTDSVWRVLFSPDGTLLASSGRDHIVRLWNVKTKVARDLIGHTDQVTRTAFSQDGTLLASASYDHTIKLWNLSDGISKTLTGHTSGVSDIVFFPDNKRLLSSSTDGSIRIWDLSTLENTILFQQNASINQVALSKDGAWILSAGSDGTVGIWNMSDGSHRLLEAHQEATLSLDFSPDGRYFASAGKDSILKLWNVKTAQSKTFSGHTKAINRVRFSPDGNWLASASSDKTVKLWNLKTETARTFTGHTQNVWGVSFSPDGSTLASFSDDSTIRLWDVLSGEGRTLRGHKSTVWHASFSPDSTLLASASGDQTVRIWKDTLAKDMSTFYQWLTQVPSSKAKENTPNGPSLWSNRVDLSSKQDKQTYQTKILTLPKPAKLYYEGEKKVLGSTPLTLTLPKTEKERVFVLQISGFQDQKLYLRGNDSLREEIRVELLPKNTRKSIRKNTIDNKAFMEMAPDLESKPTVDDLKSRKPQSQPVRPPGYE